MFILNPERKAIKNAKNELEGKLIDLNEEITDLKENAVAPPGTQ